MQPWSERVKAEQSATASDVLSAPASEDGSVLVLAWASLDLASVATSEFSWDIALV